MPIVVACGCGKKYQVGDDKAGLKMRCKACQAVIAVPTPKTTPADDVDDFGGGDDFAAGGDFGDLGDQGEAIVRKPKTAGKKGAAKSKGKPKAAGKKKPGKGKAEMAPALKYSLAGGIVVVTAGIVLGILWSRGMIGGGPKKDAGSGGDSTAGGAQAPPLAGMGPGATPGAPGIPGAKQPSNGGQAPAGPKWKPAKDWTPDAGLLTQTVGPQPLKDFPEYQFRVPKFLKPGTVPENLLVRSAALDANIKMYYWTTGPRNDNRGAALMLIVGRLPTGKQFAPGIEGVTFKNMQKRHEQTGATVTNTQPQSGQINGIDFQRQIFESTHNGNVSMGFHYVGVDQNRTVLIAINGSADASKLPVLEAAALSFQRGEKGTGKQPSTKSAATPTTIAAADLVKQNPVGSKTLEKKTIRVQGTVAKAIDQQGWMYLTGDGQRTVACQFMQAQPSPPAVGQTVVVEGTYFESRPMFITVGNCTLLPPPKAATGKQPPVGQQPPVGKQPPAGKQPPVGKQPTEGRIP